MPTMYLKWPNSLKETEANFTGQPQKPPVSPPTKNFCWNWRRWKTSMKKTFIALRAELSEKEKESTVFDPEGEAALYLRALADTRVFFEKEIDVGSMKNILKSAITAEKDSIVFYLGMKDAVAEGLGKDRLDNIIKEEMGHIKLLSRKLVSQRD